jgi:cysteine desulfurase
MSKPPIYFDYQATTPIDPRVLEVMCQQYTENFGNASSTTHVFGDRANQAVKQAAHHIAELTGAYFRLKQHHPIVFTSGTTESINLALKGYVEQNRPTHRPFRLATLPTEHKAVLDTCKSLVKSHQIELIMLKVDHTGQVDLDDLEAHLKQGIELLVVMAANNEVGTISPLETICARATEYNVPVFTDASQAAGCIPLEFENWNIAMLALTGHKMYGPMGTGALIVRKGLKLSAQIHGGGHQHGLRSGTLNVPGIVGLGHAALLRHQEMHEDEPRIAALRDQLQAGLQQAIPQLQVNGDLNARLAGNLHVSVPGLQNDILIARVREQLAIATGSACTSGVEEPSHVLTALGLSEAHKAGALRISLGKWTTPDEIALAQQILVENITALCNR